VDDGPRSADEIAKERHALNVLVPELDWLRSQELIGLQAGIDSVSDVVRAALKAYLDNHELTDHLFDGAMYALRFQAERERRRASHASPSPNG